MTIWLATTYRLFGSTNRPKRTALCRAIVFFSGLTTLSILCWRATPAGDWSFTLQNALSVSLASCLCVGLLFMLLHGYQQSFFARLQLVRFMLVSQRKLRLLYLLAASPLLMVVSAITVTTQLRFFGRQWWWVIGGSVCMALVLHVLLRIADIGWLRSPQFVSAVLLIVAGCAFRGMRLHGVWAVVGAGVLVVQSALAIAFTTRPIRSNGTMQVLVSEGSNYTMATAFAVRALRNGRYIAALAMVICLPLGLSIAARFWQALPFDAVALLGLVLMGTIALETRGLSKRVYSLELVTWAMFRRWLCSMWLVVLFVACTVVLIILACNSWWFADALSVGTYQLAAMAAGLVGVGLLAASLVVPQRQDIWTQLAAAFTYMAFSWAVIKLLRGGVGYGVTILGTCLALSYGIEYMRWIKTIRGKRGIIL